VHLEAIYRTVRPTITMSLMLLPNCYTLRHCGDSHYSLLLFTIIPVSSRVSPNDEFLLVADLRRPTTSAASSRSL
jgi:hypothetical protein